jgi:Ca2+-binding EF-hand superfamily protein
VSRMEFADWKWRQSLASWGEENEELVKEMFLRYDVDQGGTLDREEAAVAVEEMDPSINLTGVFAAKRLETVFAQMRPNEDDEVPFDHFRRWWKEKQQLDAEVEVSFESFEVWYWGRTDVLEAKQKVELRATFDRIDTDGGGTLDKKEVAVLAAELGEKLTSVFSSKKLDAAFAEMDPDGDGEVTFEEFQGWWHMQYSPLKISQKAFAKVYDQLLEKQATKEADKIREIFNRIDTDGSGQLDEKEVKALTGELGLKLGGILGLKKLDKVMKEMDPDGDGEVTFDEFSGWWRKHQEAEMKEKEAARDLKFKRDAFWARRKRKQQQPDPEPDDSLPAPRFKRGDVRIKILFRAVMADDVDKTRALVQSGVNAFAARNRAGQTAVEMASIAARKQCVAYFESIAPKQLADAPTKQP